MRKYRFLSYALALLALVGLPALAGGVYTNGLPAFTYPLTGSETLPLDTNLSAGQTPQTESITVNQFKRFQPAPTVISVITSPIAIDASGGPMFTMTLTANSGLSTPTNLTAGQVIRLLVTQDSTGSRTLTYNNFFTWPAGTQPTLSTAAGSVDMLTFVYDGLKLRGVANLLFKNVSGVP
jgi:hypothetical protein